MNFLMIKDTDLIIKLIKLDGSVFNSPTTMSVRPLGDTYSKINIEISPDDFNNIKNLNTKTINKQNKIDVLNIKNCVTNGLDNDSVNILKLLL